MLVITKISDLTYITISHNYSTELLKLPWSFPTGCFSISLQKCEFKSIGNRKWAWVVYLVSLASPNDPDLEWKPRPQLVGSAEPFARPQAVPSDFLKHFFTWFFSIVFAVDVFGNSDFVFQYDEEMNVQQTCMSASNSTSGHLNISFFLTIRYRYWKWIVYLLWIVPFDSWNRAPIHGVLYFYLHLFAYQHQDLTYQSYHILDPTPRRNKTLPTICPNP